MGRIVTAFYFPFTYFQLFQAAKRQKRFIASWLANDLEKFRKENDRSLDEQDFRKITDYYSFGVPAILGESFCLLRGTKMTLKERFASTYQGGMTGLFDDFFDKGNKSVGDIFKIIDNPCTYEGENSNERLFFYFYRKMLENVEFKGYVKKSLFDVYEAQVQSVKQTTPLLSRKEIQKITFQKGGVSLLFYRSAFSHAMNNIEQDMLYHLGGIMQLGNDIFDVYKDLQAGIETLVTTTKSINNVRVLLKDKLEHWYSFVNRVSYPKQNREVFKRFISLGMIRCFICLDQFEILEKRSGGLFSPSDYSRSDLICDMEKPGNFLKSLWYYIKN